MTPSQIKAAILAGLVVILLFFGWSCAKRDSSGSTARATVKAQAKAADRVEESVAISTQTQTRVDVEAEDTRQRTARAVETIDARIATEPAPAGPADPDVLRVAAEAHRAAIAAACRVQRTGDCPAPATTP